MTPLAAKAGQAGVRLSSSSGARHTAAHGSSFSRLFGAAFRNSRNAMALLDEARRQVDVNGAWLRMMGYRRSELVGRPIYEFVAGGPAASEAEWQAALARGDFAGEADLVTAGEETVAVQFAATVETVTASRLVLLVALSTSRWGRRFRRTAPDEDEPPGALSPREREVVRLIALGSTSLEIAEELQIAHETVRTHARNAMAKAGARSRAHLVARALGAGMLGENGG